MSSDQSVNETIYELNHIVIICRVFEFHVLFTHDLTMVSLQGRIHGRRVWNGLIEHFVEEYYSLMQSEVWVFVDKCHTDDCTQERSGNLGSRTTRHHLVRRCDQRNLSIEQRPLLDQSHVD